MSWFACRGCIAKDAEIARLWALVGPVPRETPAVPAPQEPLPEPLPGVVDQALERKYERNGREWRAETRAARMLLKDGMDPEAVALLVSKGQSVDRW